MPKLSDAGLARVFLVAVAVHAIATAAWHVQSADVALFPCLFKAVTGAPCPGCGMTRSCNSLARGRFGDAWRYNPLAFPLVALAALIAVCPRLLRNCWRRVPAAVRGAATWLTLAVVLTHWAIRWWAGAA